MDTPEDLLRLLDEELALTLEDRHLDVDFDDLEDWDSVLMVRLISVVERATGRTVDVSAALESRSLAEFYALVADPVEAG